MAKIYFVSQDEVGDEYWSKRSCGICALKMLMVFKKPELKNVSLITLINKALELNGYINNIGWKHQSLVDLANSYGVSLGFQKEFFDTPEKKKIGIKMINKNLLSGMPVAVSILKDFKIKGSAHMVIVEGLLKVGPFIVGYKIADPYFGEKGNHYIVSKRKFLNGWRGGMIYLK
jgi:hypothetical protein